MRLVGLMLLICCGCADQMLLHPSTRPANAAGAERREIQDHGRIVEAFVSRSPGAKSSEPRAYVLEFCGNATRAEYVIRYIADRWGERPVEVWVMNYPGFGASTGPAKLDAIAPAALATYDALAKVAGGKPIILSGFSLGTCAALYVAGQRPALAILLQSPPPLQRGIMERYGFWTAPFVMQIPSQLDSLENAAKVKIPAVFILSGKDQTVPPRFQQMVVDAYAGEKHLVPIPDAGHNSEITAAAAEQLQHELDWIWSRISPISGDCHPENVCKEQTSAQLSS